MDISIIIPVYNAEQYLRECLDSALAQTVKEKEIICIDDGSTDESGLILQEYSDKYKEVKIIRQENKGAGEARNIGLEMAEGEFVCFLDADDYYLDSDALEKMIDVCKKHQVKACAGLRKIHTENNEIEDFELYREFYKNKNGTLLKYLDYQEEYYYQNYIFLRKEIETNHIKFPPYRRYQDAPFFVNVMLHICEYWILPVELYCYRYSQETYMRKGKNIKDTLNGIKDNLRVAKENRLYLLENRLLERINHEYYEWISSDLSMDILQTLFEIKKILQNEEKSIRIIEEIQNYYELKKSHYIMESFLKISQNNHELETYFISKGIDKIAIYGLGTFGKILAKELGNSKKIKIYGIDQKEQVVEGVSVGKIEEINSKCNIIIITPLREAKKIEEQVKKCWKGRIYILSDVLRLINY